MDVEESNRLMNENRTKDGTPFNMRSFFKTKKGKIVLFCILFLFVLVTLATGGGYYQESEDEEEQEENEMTGEIDIFMDEVDPTPMDCSAAEIEKYPENSHARLVKEADCGSGFPYDDSSIPTQKPVHVILYGDYFHSNLALSGCLLGANRCPHTPKCVMNLANHLNDPNVAQADVVVFTTTDADALQDVMHHTSKKKKVYSVLYWREPYWPYINIERQKKFDLRMGVMYNSQIVNPVYIRRPHTLVAKSFFEFLPFEQRDKFALSIISNCHSNSQRQIYIDHLTDYLGAERVHQYGRCGTRKLPPPPINNAAKVIAKYKFYFSFENSVMDGYVSEKLFTVLNMQLLPVYLGTPKVLNITKTPSFINVFHFRTPKALAEYLMYLDTNPEAYHHYHVWRKDTSYFTEDYLNVVKYGFPGQAELKPLHHVPQSNRIAACCRLCNLDFLATQVSRITDKDYIERRIMKDRLNHLLFSGTINHRPGPNALLDKEKKKKKSKDEEVEEEPNSLGDDDGKSDEDADDGQ